MTEQELPDALPDGLDSSASPTEILVVLTNAIEGRDEAFNEWYDAVHVPDVLGKLEGFAAVQRFEIAGESAEDSPYRYLAIYEIESGRLEDAARSLTAARSERRAAAEAGRKPEVPISPSMADDRKKWYFQALGPKRTASDREANEPG